MQHLQSRLPLYKQWFVEAAEQSSQDWRLLAAIGYQESKWNPSAAHPLGAPGPHAIDGGDRQRDARSPTCRMPGRAFSAAPATSGRCTKRFPLTFQSRIAPGLRSPPTTSAIGHLEDARVLAQKAGRDPDSWQDVRDFLPLLEEERWYTQTENGYARGREPVRYVDNVRGYRDLLEWAWGDGPQRGRFELAAALEELPQQRRGLLRCTRRRIHPYRCASRGSRGKSITLPQAPGLRVPCAEYERATRAH